MGRSGDPLYLLPTKVVPVETLPYCVGLGLVFGCNGRVVIMFFAIQGCFEGVLPTAREYCPQGPVRAAFEL